MSPPDELPSILRAVARGINLRTEDRPAPSTCTLDRQDPGFAFVAVMGLQDPPALGPIEQAAVRGAVPKRRSEFAWGRWCARAALAAVGHQVADLPVGPLRAPSWPPQTAGSISHVEGLVCAAALRGLRRFGIDVERLDRVVDSATWALILSPEELQRFAAMERFIAFAAKEATFKALSKQAGEYFGFECAEVRLLPENRIDVIITRPLQGGIVAGTTLQGSYLVFDDFVFTMLWA